MRLASPLHLDRRGVLTFTGAPAGMTSGQITALATAIIALAAVGVAVALVPVAWKLRQAYAKLDALLDRLRTDTGPLIEHATTATRNIEYITAKIRGDVQRIDATITDANERVHQAMDATQNRLNEFSALLSVVQSEAESLFVSTASTVRGVRRGATSLSGRDGMDLASGDTDELDDHEPAERESEEIDHGDTSDPDGPAQTLPAPRVRPRPARRRTGGGI